MSYGFPLQEYIGVPPKKGHPEPIERGDDIEVDPKLLEDGYDDDYESAGYDTSTASLTSSVNEYVYENGRRYHAYYGMDKNVIPTDETEQDRMDLHHEIFLKLVGDLHKAPIGPNPQAILDIGTGTGIWAIDMADKYPSAEVIGMDLSPIQPGWVPPNCRFELDDAEEDWTYHQCKFDFVHARNVAQAINNWPKLMRQIYRATKPGGYVELAELNTVMRSDDTTVRDTHGLKIYMDKLGEAMVKLGRPANISDTFLKSALTRAGFVDVTAIRYKQPIGPWPKDERLKKIGMMCLLSASTGYHAYGMMAFTRILGMDPKAADDLCNEAAAASKNKNIHGYNYFWVVYGRRPL